MNASTDRVLAELRDNEQDAIYDSIAPDIDKGKTGVTHTPHHRQIPSRRNSGTNRGS